MTVVTMKQLLEAGVHFGHQTRRWDPKMAPYIFTQRNGIYIIDLQKTIKMLDDAYNYAKAVAADGGVFLFVGTKKQAQDPLSVGVVIACNEDIIFIKFYEISSVSSDRQRTMLMYKAVQRDCSLASCRNGIYCKLRSGINITAHENIRLRCLISQFVS